jgi:hypothetical protein
MDPKCRYCGKRRSAARKMVSSRLPGAALDPSRCPLDGHLLPPAPPDCRGCAGACIVCEDERAPLPCPHCGRTI